MTNVAIVILNYNGEDYLSTFLPPVLAHSKKAQLIVADNASTDGSVNLLKSDFPMVQLIELEQNFGFAGGYNEALKEAEAEYFVLLNSDIEVSPNWLDPLIGFLDENDTYAACQPKIKDYNHRARFEYAGACGGFIDTLGYPYCRGRLFDEIEIDSGQYNEAQDIFWASGACMVIRSKIFFELGGFDSDFFAHMEEIDLCWRIQSNGYRIKCLPESTVYHVGGGTLNKTSPFKTYLNFRNGLYLLLKNLPLSSLIFKLPARLIMDWIAAFKFVGEGNIKHSIAIIKAHWSFLYRFLKILGKRKQLSGTPNQKSIVFQYYVQGKRRFSEL